MHNFHLISKSQFRGYKKGYRITDPVEIEKILLSAEKRMVTKISLLPQQAVDRNRLMKLFEKQLKVVVQSINSLTVPDAYVMIVPPQPVIQGIATNVVGVVGIASYGPVDVPVTVGNPQQEIQSFGPVLPVQYDLGSAVYNASLQDAQQFICIRVTDGTDTSAFTDLLDVDSGVGAVLTSLYTGEFANTITATISIGSSYTPSVPTYKLVINISGGIPETFDNLGGTGTEFWQNLVNAVNLGQSIARGPSQIVVASLPTGIEGVDIVTGGQYTSTPGYSFSGAGSGATVSPKLRIINTGVTVVSQGLDYAAGDTILLAGGTHSVQAQLTVTATRLESFVLDDGGSLFAPGDTITFTDGTFTVAAVITVDTVDGGGAILTAHVSTKGVYTVNSAGASYTTSGSGVGAAFSGLSFGVNSISPSTPGNYTALPSNPVSQQSSSGAGTGATFNLDWEIFQVAVLTTGSGYDISSGITFTGGTPNATATLQIGSIGAPEQDSYDLAGGTNGNSGVTSTTLVGSDVSPRTGMYALRQAGAFVTMLADADDPAEWPAQSAFSLSEACYVVGTIAAGYQDNIPGSLALLQASAIDNYGFKLMQGDWVQFNDPFNNVTRYVSPQAFCAGELVFQPPYQSSLNKPMQGIVATQRTAEGNPYSTSDLSQLITGRLDVITRPIPVSTSQFGCRLGVNTSSNSLTNTDNYPMMVNYIGRSISDFIGVYVGQSQTPAVQTAARNAIQQFLMTLFQQGWIGDVNDPGNAAAAFQVILDSSNNPPNRVAAGYMQADVTVVIFSIIQFFVVNLNLVQGSSNIAIPTPQTNT